MDSSHERQQGQVHRGGISGESETTGHKQPAEGNSTSMKTAYDVVEGEEAEPGDRSRDAMKD